MGGLWHCFNHIALTTLSAVHPSFSHHFPIILPHSSQHFCQLGEAKVALLTEVVVTQRFSPGSNVFQQGDEGAG